MGRLFLLTAWHRGYLCLDPQSGRIASARLGAAFLRYPPVLAHFPEAGDLAILAPLTETDATIAVPPDAYCNAVLPMRAVWRGEGVALLHPASLRYLSVRLIAPDESLGQVSAEAERPADQEIFTPFEAPPALVMAPVLARLEAAAVLLARPHDAGSVLHYIAQSKSAFAAVALDALLPLLPLAQIEQLAQIFLRDPDALTQFGARLPEDVWATQGLPRLRAWLAAREKNPPVTKTLAIGPDLDFLATAGQGHYVSLAHAANALARREVRAQRDLCVIASVRNHGIYLLEWLAYHRGIGVEQFFLYSNDSLGDSDLLLGALADAGEIVWIANRVAPEGPAEQPEEKTASHALTLLPEVLDYRWAAMLHPDQFLLFDPARFASVAAFLAWQETRDVDAIEFDHIRLGASGARVRREAPVIRRCRDWVGPRNGALVALVRPHRFIHDTHGPRTDQRHDPLLRAANGDALSRRPPPAGVAQKPGAAAEFAAIHDYVFKSAEEYLWRRSNGIRFEHAFDPDSKQALLQYLEAPARGGFAFADRADRCAPDLDAGIARLRALPGVAEAEVRVEQAYRAGIRRIRQAWPADLPGLDLDQLQP